MQKTFPINLNNNSLSTPGKNPFAVPTEALHDAIEKEWAGANKYNAAKMPLTTLAYTAIDRIAGQEKLIVETLMVYIDTDTLSYRATGSEKLAKMQEEQWNPVLAWVKKHFNATWETTTGLTLEQPQALHKAVEKRLQKLDHWQLAACCLLASGYSSLALMLAVLDGHISGLGAFDLSRLEEESQAAQWGRDSEADARAARLKDELLEAERFLRLLHAS